MIGVPSECGGVGDLLEFEGECFVFGMGIVACVDIVTGKQIGRAHV